MSRKKAERQPIQRLEPDVNVGLNKAQVEERVQKGYVNVSEDPHEKSAAKIILDNTFTFFNVVLFSIALVFVAAIIYLSAIGRSDIVNTYFGFSKFVFVVPAIMNVAMGSFQQFKSLAVIKKLRIVTETKCKVIRDGEVETIEAKDVVLDDVASISAGDQAQADMVVISGEVFVDESMLTGEADHVKKVVGDTVLSGSAIIVGDARCRVTAVGNDTYASALTRKVKSAGGHKSELMSSIMNIMKILTVGLLIAVVTVFISMIVKINAYGNDASVWDGMTLSLNDPVTWSLILLTGGTYGVGMLPSGLVLTSSVALMVSIAQLTKKKTLIQELYSLENLSRVDVICLDKTGTLTDGTMNVVDVKSFIPDEEVAEHARALMAATGERNATAEAIYKRFGIAENAKIKEKIPFSSAVKYSGLVYENGKKLLMGAPEYLLDKDDENLEFSAACAKEGKRVIAMTLDGALLAFFVIEDHIRDTAADTLKFFRENGVTVKVISGDNPLTVAKIAEQCGIENSDKYVSLAGVPLEEIDEIADKYTVFARVSPEQKEALVTALQKHGHKVAMTGDGVNDILALRKSNSSITFAKATEAAKSCADVVLLDNDFSHLKDVVGEGRRVIGNIEKTSVLYLIKSIAVFLFAFALIPFKKGQMWLSIENLYMLEASVIGTGGFLLSLEPIRKPIKGSFMRNILTQAAAAGILAAVAILLPLVLYTVPKYYGATPFVAQENVRTMMTVMLTMAGFVVVFSMCIPFNKYRRIALLALLGTAAILGLLFPASYIGGRTMGADMLKFDKAAGETIFSSQLFNEMFRPMNSDIFRNLVSDNNNFIVLRIFLYVAVPAYILVRFAIENSNRKNYGKDVKLNRSFRIARRFMLASGFVFMLYALLMGAETAFFTGTLVRFSESSQATKGLVTFVNALFAVAYFAVGYIGYKTWKDPTKKMIKVGFVAAISLVAITVVKLILSGMVVIRTQDPLLIIDNALILALTAVYIVGALMVRSQIKLGLLKPRDK